MPHYPVVQLVPYALSFVRLQMSLTLEEKQRLAKEQEQAAKLRNQQPLAPQAAKQSASSNNQVKPKHSPVCRSPAFMINLTWFRVAG